MDGYAFPIEIGKCVKRLKWVKSQISMAKRKLSSFPDGTLQVCSQEKGRTLFYEYENGERTHIGKDRIRVAERLAQKEYLVKALKELERERDALEHFVASYKAAGEPDMHVKKLELVKERIMMPEEYAAWWQAQDYPKSLIPFGETRYFTGKGERVRSRIEVIIADKLAAAGMPYHYEKPIVVDGRAVAWPDFTILDPKTGREYLWEHFGMVEKEDYRRNMLVKVRRLGECGYAEGINLIVTMESTEVPMDTEQIDRIIRLLQEGLQ